MSVKDLVTQIEKLDGRFGELTRSHNAVSFERECLFARQILEGNQYLQRVAWEKPHTLEAAILNVASIGISLNPAQKHAYLVPRREGVTLVPSYMGLCHLAQESGSIRFVQAKVVYETEDFELGGVDEKPVHRSRPFAKDKGEIVGAYVVAKTSDNDYLTHVMAIEDIYKIRDRSDGYKAHQKKGITTPWVTDPVEMIKKTVVRQASKLWPKVDRRMQEAIETLDSSEEGIDFEKEKQEAEQAYEKRKEEKKKEGDETLARRMEELEKPISEITELLRFLTAGMEPNEKGAYMVKTLNVRQFDELKKKKPEELEVLIGKLKKEKEAVQKPRTAKDVKFSLN